MIDKLKKAHTIVEDNSRLDMFLFYVNTRNFRINKVSGEWEFDADYFITCMPMWSDQKSRVKIEYSKPGNTITDRIQGVDNYMPLSEWIKTDKPKEAIRRVFEKRVSA